MISNGVVVSTNNGFNDIFNNSMIMENLFKSAAAKTSNTFDENEKIGENNNTNNSTSTFDCKSCTCSFSSEIELWAHRRSAHSQGVVNGAVPPARPTLPTATEPKNNKIFNPEAYCDLCDKEFCNKYFLKTHKANKHGVYGGGPAPGDDPSPTSMVVPSGAAKNATTTPTTNGGGAEAAAANIESQVQMAQNRLASILDAAAAAAAVGTETPPLKQTELDASGGVENGEISDEAAAAAAAALFQNLPANFGSNLYLQSLESSPCPFCHQVFANAFLLQSHIFTFHSMGTLPPTSTSAVGPAALYALMNASSSASFNPFLAQQLKMFAPNQFSMFSSLPATTTSAQTSTSFSGGVGQMADLPTFAGLDLPLVDEAKRHQTPPQKGPPTFNDQSSESAAFSTTTSAATATASAALQYAAASSNVHQKSGATTAAKQQQQQNAAAAAEAFCDLCRKVFCNKYFLRTHKLNKHGISPAGGVGDTGAETFNGSPNSIHRKRAYNKTGQHSQIGQHEFGAKVKIENEAANGLSQKDEESSNVSRENEENASFNGILDLALFSVDSTEAKRRRLTPQVSNDYEAALNFSTNSSEGRIAGASTVNGVAAAHPVDLDAYCDICCKEFCSKYFLKQHKFKIHGVVPDWSPVQNRNSPGSAVVDFTAKSQDLENLPKLTLSKGGDFSGSAAAETAAKTPKTSTSAGGARHFPSTSKNFCDICNKEVCNKYYIRTHMLKMHGVIIDENKTIIGNINVFDEKSKSFRCDICGKEMPNKHQLRNHIHLMHMSGNSSFFDLPNQTMSDQDDYHLKIQEESFEKSPNSKPQIPALLNTETRNNNRRFKNVSRWLKNDHHVISSGDPQSQHQSKRSSPNGYDDDDVRVCEYCGLQCDDQVELQLHVIDAHQQEVNGAAEQTALDAICSLKSKNIDQSSKDQHDADAENAAVTSSVVVRNVETTAADGSLNLTRRFSRIDETIDRIVAAKEISAAAAAAAASSTPPSSSSSKPTTINNASTLAESSSAATPMRQPTATASSDQHLPMVARNDLGAKMYKCSYCNYYTRWISNLSTHEKRHNAGVALTLDRNDRPFVCRICLRAYRYAHSLKRHMEVHRLSSLGMQIQMMAQAQSLPNLLQSPVVAPLPDDSSKTKNRSFAAETRSPSRSTPIKIASSSSATKNFAPSSTASTSPQKIAYVCSFCDKQFRNRELYRMHLYIIHKTSPLKASKNLPSATVRKASPAKKAAPITYNCKICGLSTKVYDVLRDHMEKEHGTVPRITNNGNGSPATGGGKKDANDSCNSPLNLKTKWNAAQSPRDTDGLMVGSYRSPSLSSSAPLSLVVKPSPLAPNGRRAFSAASSAAAGRFAETAVAKKGSVSPTSDSSENDKRTQPQPQPYIMQAFFIKEKSPSLTTSSPFVPGVVYLPVLRHLDAPFDAKFSLFPVDRDDLSPADSQLENELPISQSP